MLKQDSTTINIQSKTAEGYDVVEVIVRAKAKRGRSKKQVLVSNMTDTKVVEKVAPNSNAEISDYIVLPELRAIRSFLQFGKQVNSTTISPIPKSSNASGIANYGLIFCYNVLHKDIAKVLATRLEDYLKTLVDLA
ncbi:hypothetical protein Ancab_039167 [Ancistrocladus abbreviatus]